MTRFCKILAAIIIAITLPVAVLFLFAFLSVFGSPREGAMSSAAANAGGFGGAIIMALLAMIVYLLASSQLPEPSDPKGPKSASDYGL